MFTTWASVTLNTKTVFFLSCTCTVLPCTCQALGPVLVLHCCLVALSPVQLFCGPTYCRPTISYVYGILQARILEWFADSFSMVLHKGLLNWVVQLKQWCKKRVSVWELLLRRMVWGAKVVWWDSQPTRASGICNRLEQFGYLCSYKRVSQSVRRGKENWEWH